MKVRVKGGDYWNTIWARTPRDAAEGHALACAEDPDGYETLEIQVIDDDLGEHEFTIEVGPDGYAEVL